MKREMSKISRSDSTKIKNLKDFTEENLRKEIFDLIWPYEKLKIDINMLDRVSLPAAKIASFLFKAQLVEIELRGLLDSLDFFIELKTMKSYICRKVSVETKEERKDYALSKLKKELNNYHSPELQKLKTKISLFDKERNKFTHSLFLQRKWVEELAKESEGYKKHAEESLILIKKIKGNIWKN